MIYPDIKRHTPAAGRPPRWIGQWKTTIVSPKGNARINSLYSTVHIHLLPLLWTLLLHTRQAWQQQQRMFGPLVRLYRSKQDEPASFRFRLCLGRWGYKGISLECSFKSSQAGATVYIGSPTSENDFRLHLGIPYAHFYVTLSHLLPGWLKPEHSRRISIDFHNYTLWWAFWTSGSHDYQSDRAFPKWRKGHWNYADWLLGDLQQQKRIDSRHEDVLIGMPEGSYRAVVEMDTIKLFRPRWPWPVAKFTYGNVEVAEGIPIPGKFGGEGMAYSYHGPATSQAAAVAKFIEHVYEKRGIGGRPVELNSEYTY